jgi:hypothetical protein
LTAAGAVPEQELGPQFTVAPMQAFMPVQVSAQGPFPQPRVRETQTLTPTQATVHPKPLGQVTTSPAQPLAPLHVSAQSIPSGQMTPPRQAAGPRQPMLQVPALQPPVHAGGQAPP